MKRTFLFAFILYREFVVYTLIFTAAAVRWLLWFGPSGYIYIGWIKIMGFALLAAFYWFFRKDRLLFFQNFRLPAWQLLVLALAMDSLQTCLLLYIVSLFFL